jgi:hypothetical protein
VNTTTICERRQLSGQGRLHSIPFRARRRADLNPVVASFPDKTKSLTPDFAACH